LKTLLKAAWQKKYGTRFSARRITFERKIAYLLLSGKITQEVYNNLLASGDGVQLLPKDLSPLHVEKLQNTVARDAAAKAAADAAAAAASAADSTSAAAPAAPQEPVAAASQPASSL
jgi:uncharacterized membrane protein